MDYLADLTVIESCSILEQTTPTKNGGTASCRSAVFFGLEEEEGRGRTRESGRMGEDFERKKEKLEDGQRDFEMMETRLPRGRKTCFREGKNK